MSSSRIIPRGRSHVVPRTRARAAAGGGGAPIYALTDAALISTYLQGLKSPAIVGSLAPSDGFNFNAGVGQFSVGAFLGGGSFDATYNASTVATANGQGIPQTRGVAGDASDAMAWDSTDDVLFAFDVEAWLLLFRFVVTAAPAASYGMLGRGFAASPHYALLVNSDGTLTARAKFGFGGPPSTVTLAGSVADGVPRWGALYRSLTSQVLGVARAGVAPVTFAIANTASTKGADTPFTVGDNVNSTTPHRGGPPAVIDHLLGLRANAEAAIANVRDILDGLEAAEA